MASFAFPAWYLGRHPDHRFVLATHTSKYAAYWGGRVRDSLKELGDPLFKVKVRTDKKAENEWSFQGHPESGMVAVGVRTALTGRGANCLDGETPIQTPQGIVDIATLVQLGYDGDVACWDHENDCLAWRKVQAAWGSDAKEIVEVETESGRVVRCTPEHRFYVVGRGYTEASLLRPGDSLRIMSSLREKAWEPNKKDSFALPEMLQGGKERDADRAEVRLLQKSVSSSKMRVREVQAKRPQRQLLLSRMLNGPSRNQESSPVPQMQRSCRQEDSKVLPGLQAGHEEAEQEIAAQDVWSLRIHVRAQLVSSSVLHQEVCGRGAFCQDDRPGQLPLQDRNVLRQAVQRDVDLDSPEGREEMRLLWSSGKENYEARPWRSEAPVKLGRSPYRRESDEQPAGESSRGLRQLSFDSSSLEKDSVSVVRRIRCEGQRVYDLQVEGCHNFFAGEILVHNCLAIDDPVADAEQAFSPTIRQKNWDWYLSVAETRMEPDAVQVVLMTLWHPDDLGCRIVKSWEEGSLPYEVIRLPALAEEDDPLGRKPGEALWPERFSEADLIEKRDKSPFWWDALYRQCLVASTPVKTQRGMVRIDDVIAGDLAMTRQGFRPVIGGGKTKEVMSLCSVLFSNGSVLCGTPDHPVWLNNRSSYFALASIGRGDYTLPLWEDQSHRQPKSNGSEERNISDAKAIGISGSGLPDSSDICTGTNGSTIAGAFPLAVTFITKTETQATIESRILNASPIPSMGNGTILRERIESSWTQSVISAFPGIKAQKVELLTRRMAALHFCGNGPARNTPGTSVLNARLDSGRVILESQSFAAESARIATESEGGRKTAPIAERTSFHQTLARRPVLGGAEILCGVPVYDLEVEDAHEFYADGILVHNCPTPEGGAIFKADWFGHYQTVDREDMCWQITETGRLVFKRETMVFMVVDPALGRTTTSDNTAIGVFAFDNKAGEEGTLLLLHMIAKRIPVADVIQVIEQTASAWGVQWVGMEANGFQMLLAQAARKEVGVSIRELDPQGRSKLSRAVPAINRAAAGGICLPDEAGHPWVASTLEEVCNWTGQDGDRDDQVDCLAYACLECLRYGGQIKVVRGKEKGMVFDRAKVKSLSQGGLFRRR